MFSVPCKKCSSTTFVPIHDCAHTSLCPDTFVPTHVCTHTRLCPHMFVPTHVFCPDTFMPRHDCAYMIVPTWLCTCMTVPRHIVPQHELWPDTIMALDNNTNHPDVSRAFNILHYNNNIIIVSTRLCVNLIDENTNMLNCCWRSEVKCDYLTTVQQLPCSIPFFRNFIITCQGTKYVSGHKRVWAKTCVGTNVRTQSCGLKHVYIYMGTNVWSPTNVNYM